MEEIVAQLPVNSVHAAFSPDGRWLVTGSSEEYQFWETSSWKPARRIPRSDSGGSYGMIGFSPDGRMVAVTDSQQSVRLLNPASGDELATLNSPQPIKLTWLCFSPDGRHLAAASLHNGIQLWDLRLVREELAALKLDWDSPPWPPLPSDARASPITATVFDAPRNPIAGAHAIAPRDPQSRSNLVDLSAFYNAAMTNCWFNPAWRNDLSSLPQGIRTLQGVEYDLRGVIQLHGTSGNFAVEYPSVVTGIPMHQTSGAFHFLHATGWEPENGTRVGEYVLHYRDGLNLPVPLVYGKNIRCWTRLRDDPATLAKGSAVAWRGTTPSLALENYDAVLYDFRFPNPRPEVEVKSIDFRSAGTEAAPFLVAITAE